MYLSYISYSSDFSGSSVISTVPRISTYRPVLVSRTSRLIRGSRIMFRVFNRPVMVLNSTVSPSRLTNMTDDCGRPSAFDVAIVATCGPSSTARAVSLSFTVIAVPFCVYGSWVRPEGKRSATGHRAVPVDCQPDAHSWEGAASPRNTSAFRPTNSAKVVEVTPNTRG